MGYAWHLLTLFGVYATLAASLVVVVADLGILSVAHAALFGIGAYSSALLGLHLQLPFAVCMLMGSVAAAFTAIGVSILAGYLDRDRLVLATVALQVGFQGLAQNLTAVTGGSRGVVDVRGIEFFGVNLDSGVGTASVSLLLLAAALAVLRALRRGRYASAVHCVRDDPVFAQSLGLNPFRYRAGPLIVCAALAGASGAVYGSTMRFVDPTTFSLNESILILAMVGVGAGRSLLLALLGTGIVIGLPEVLRAIGVSGGSVGNVRQIVMGLILAMSAMVFMRRWGVPGVRP